MNYFDLIHKGIAVVGGIIKHAEDICDVIDTCCDVIDKIDGLVDDISDVIDKIDPNAIHGTITWDDGTEDTF